MVLKWKVNTLFAQPVSAVADGLKAWETLKDKARNIDLILTEVELPLISGFALLSLVMEHEVCKNIPVISTSPRKPLILPWCSGV